MNKSVTPLPPTLSGTILQRLIEIDEALIPYVSGALSWLCDKEPFEETGALTVETAKEHFSDMLWTYFQEFSVTPVGATMIWHMETPPDRWLVCDGSSALKADYPELYALFGAKYGESVDFFGLPNLRSRIPYGADFDIELDEAAGEATHTLTEAEMPAHIHSLNDLGHTHNHIRSGGAAGGAYTNVAGATNTNPVNTTWPTQTAFTGISINSRGGGLAHNNIPPVLGVNFIVYAGRG